MVEATTPTHDDDEKYLYGEGNDPSKSKSSNGTGSADTTTESQPPTTPTTTGVLPLQELKKDSQDEADDEDDYEEESDDDDDDNIQVHIGEVNTATPGPYGTPVNWKKEEPSGTAASTANKLATLPTQGQKKIDVNAVGLINGQPIYEYDLDTEQDEKPWRKPGADISDYFNYGFNEETWKQYCDKQRRMRMESQRSPYTVTQAVNPTQNAQVEIEVLPDGRTRVKAGPPPDRKVEGSIHVLGSSEDARRKQKEDELLALALNTTRVLPPGVLPAQRPLYALPGGAMMYNPMPGQPMPPQMMAPLPTTSHGGDAQGENSVSDAPTSQPQQIQSLGGGPPIQVQYMSGPQIPGLQQILPPGAPVFQAPGVPMGMEFQQQDPFMQHGVMMPPMGAPHFNHFAGESDSDQRDSDGETSRRHRSRRESKHSSSRRHRDRSDRDRTDRDKDRDRDRSSRRDRDRSDARRSGHADHSKTSSDRKSKHSSSRSSIKLEDDESSRKSSRVSSRRSKQSSSAAADVAVEETESVKKEPAEQSERTVSVKQEPSGD